MKTVKLLAIIFMALIIIGIGFEIYVIDQAEKVLAETKVTLAKVNTSILLIQQLEPTETEIDVIFTNFVGTQLGSGIDPIELSVNEQGLVTYQNKVVIATATYECLNSSYGGCKHIEEVPSGYMVFNYFDEMQIEYDGVKYQAIVLDSCGDCSIDKNEDYQRFDVLVASDYDFTKIVGKVILSN